MAVLLVPWKNCTELILPSLSVAQAFRGTDAGAVKVWVFVGLLICTVGSALTVMFTLADPEPLLLGDEPIWRDGVLVGRITSGAYGHTLGRSVGMGYVSHAGGVDAAFVRSGRWELELATERFAAAASLEPPYDPRSARVRA